MTIVSRDKVCSLLTVAVGAFLLSCGNDITPNPHLLDSEVEAPEIDDELKYLRSLQAVRYQIFPQVGCIKLDRTGGIDSGDLQQNTYFSESCENVSPATLTSCSGTGSPAPCELPRWVNVNYFLGSGAEDDPLIEALTSNCRTRIDFYGCINPPDGGAEDAPCGRTTCEALRELCLANTLLEITGARVEPLVVSYGTSIPPFVLTGGQVRIPAQSTATNAALSETAAQKAQQASERAIAALTSIVQDGNTCSLADGSALPLPIGDRSLPVGIGDRTFGDILTTATIEGLQLSREAIDRAVDTTVAFADTFRSNPNVEKGIAAQLTGRLLSRGRAARLLVLGNLAALESVAPSTRDPVNLSFCNAPPLTSATRRALELLRASAVDPAVVLARPGRNPNITPISLEDFLSDVLSRLVALNDVDPETDLASAFGLRDEDFQAAREYLAQEILAFGRDQTRLVTEVSLSPVAIYAATRNEPSPLPPIYYAALAGRPPFNPATNEIQGEAVFANNTASLIGKITHADLADPDLAHAIQDPLIFFNQSRKNELLGTWKVTTSAANNTLIVSDIFGFDTFDGLIVVGEKGLSCAVQGHVEGTECQLDTTPENPLDPKDAVVLQIVNRNSGASGNPFYPIHTHIESSRYSDTLGERLYMVVPKTGVASPGPGDYRAIAVVPYSTAFTGETGVPIAPDKYERAGQLLTPSTEWCARPTKECDGSTFDERLPLEDELTDDNDGVESSWKYYLGLAKQAAAESDLLANEYIQAGLELDIREEELELRANTAEISARNQLETLQNACGTSVNLQPLLDALKSETGDDLDAAIGVPVCPPGDPDCSCTDGACEAPYVCDATSGRCLTSLEQIIETLAQEDPEMERVKGCLLPGTTRSAVTVGDQPLCFTRTPEHPNQICIDPSGARVENCPAVAKVSTDTEPATYTCPDDGRAWEQTVDQLGYYHHQPLGPLDSPNAGSSIQSACRALRGNILDKRVNGTAVLSWLLSDNSQWRYFFEPRNIADVAERIGYEDEPANFARLTLDGRTWKTNGKKSMGRFGSWIRTAFPDPGTLENGADAEWPCDGLGAQPVERCSIDPTWTREELQEATNNSSSLFCTFSAARCENQEQRVLFNRRLFNALAFLRTSTGTNSGSGISVGSVHLALPPELTRNETTLYPFGTGEEGDGLNFAPLTKQEVENTSGRATLYLPDTTFISDKLWNDMEDSDQPLAIIDAQQFEGYCAEAEDESCQIARSVWDGLSLGSSFQIEGASALAQGLSGQIYTSFIDPSIEPSSSITTNLYAPSGGGISQLTRRDITVSAGLPFVEVGMHPYETATFEIAYDAMELYCEASAELATSTAAFDRGCVDADTSTIQIDSVEDLSKASNRVACMADTLEAIAAHTLLFNFPETAIDALKQQSALGPYPGIGGEYARQVAAIRAALIELHDKGPKIASEVNKLSYDMDELRTLFQQGDIRKKIEKLNFWKELSQEVANCTNAVADANGPLGVALSLAKFGGPALSAAATCINTAIQVNLSSQISELQQEFDELQNHQGLIDFRRNFEARSEALRDLGTAITTAQESLDGALAELENLQKAGRRSLRDAIWLSTRQASQQYNINAVMRRRFHTARVRYEEAHKHSVRMAFLAKRAVETRLGERLSEMTDDLPLVGAPSQWEAEVCSTAPVDYLALRDTAGTEEISGPEDPGPSPTFADTYIGSYVRKLESVVESYRQLKNFHEGTDTAVISLRDDIFKDRAECPSPSLNLVANSAALREWESIGCNKAKNCVSLTETGDAPFDPAVADASGVTGYRVTFGVSPTADGEIVDCIIDDSCGLNPSVRYRTSVALRPDRYLLSWYSRPVVVPGDYGDANPDGSGSVAVFAPDGSPVDTIAGTGIPAINGWTRQSSLVTIPSGTGLEPAGSYVVAIVPDAIGNSVALPHQVDIAAVQIEKATTTAGDNPVGLGVDGPLPFEATDESVLKRARTCQDTDGQTFRGAHWRRGCLRLCNDGFTGNCRPVDAKEVCYREASFALSQQEIEDGDFFANSAFAYGNFNYRIEDIGLNFVGTEIQGCSNNETPQSCYSSGFVQYTLLHEGPYFVRNYDGDDTSVALFPGRIEHARGLATERYVTNPISDTDRSLIEDYMRHEFRGRPLDGRFVIRVWEDQNGRFELIQDIQMVLKYRYWTRFN